MNTRLNLAALTHDLHTELELLGAGDKTAHCGIYRHAFDLEKLARGLRMEAAGQLAKLKAESA